MVPLVAGAALAGACWGIVLPGLVDRLAVEWPPGEPRPPWRTSCNQCGANRSRWWRSAGRCPACDSRPRPGRRITVPLSAVAWAVVAAAVGPSTALPAYLVFAAVAVPLALIDLKVLRLPDPLLGTAFLGGAALLAIAALTTGDATRLLRSGYAAVACGGVYLLLALVPRSQLGFGDVRLGAVLGLYLGWSGWFAVAAAVVLAPLVNLPLAVGALVTRPEGRKASVPYGPAMLGAALAALVLAALRQA